MGLCALAGVNWTSAFGCLLFSCAVKRMNYAQTGLIGRLIMNNTPISTAVPHNHRGVKKTLFLPTEGSESLSRPPVCVSAN